MPTQWLSQDIKDSVGMDTKSAETEMPQNRLRLAQNVTYREPGALVKRNGFSKVNNTVPTN